MFYRKLHRYAKGPISEGAVAAGDWGSFLFLHRFQFQAEQLFREGRQLLLQRADISHYHRVLALLPQHDAVGYKKRHKPCDI